MDMQVLEHVSMAQLEQCVAYAHGQAHNTPSDGAQGDAQLTGQSHSGQSHSGGAVSTAAASAADSSYVVGFSALPSEEELSHALSNEHALIMTLCHVYAQDSICLSELYEPPPMCRLLLGVMA